MLFIPVIIWIITNSLVNLTSFCYNPYNYWDEKQGVCVASTGCHVDTVINNDTKVCVYNQVFGFNQRDLSVANAEKIAVQGDYIIILKSDKSLWQYNINTALFKSLSPPPLTPPITLISITISNKGIIYSCTSDNKLWSFNIKTSTWTLIALPISPNVPTTCLDVKIGYGSQSRLYLIDIANKTYFLKDFTTWTDANVYSTYIY